MNETWPKPEDWQIKEVLWNGAPTKDEIYSYFVDVGPATIPYGKEHEREDAMRTAEIIRKSVLAYPALLAACEKIRAMRNTAREKSRQLGHPMASEMCGWYELALTEALEELDAALAKEQP